MEENEEFERVCFNCNNFFPTTMDDPTEFGICLNEKEFEPFIDELVDNYNYAPCQSLVDKKKFAGDSEACLEFSEIDESESFEIDEKSVLGKKIISAIKSGTIDKEMWEDLIIEEQLRNDESRMDRKGLDEFEERDGAKWICLRNCYMFGFVARTVAGRCPDHRWERQGCKQGAFRPVSLAADGYRGFNRVAAGL
jgi:hypothetical protein